MIFLLEVRFQNENRAVYDSVQRNIHKIENEKKKKNVCPKIPTGAKIVLHEKVKTSREQTIWLLLSQRRGQIFICRSYVIIILLLYLKSL